MSKYAGNYPEELLEELKSKPMDFALYLKVKHTMLAYNIDDHIFDAYIHHIAPFVINKLEQCLKNSTRQ